MKKKLLLISLLAVAVLALAACTPQAPAATPTPQPQAEQPSQAPAAPEVSPEVSPEASPQAASAQAAAPEGGLELTLEELAKFNGKDGARAYVAVDGIIYDVTDSSMWKNGDHNGFEAGSDLTDAIKNKSPHGTGKLDGVPEVGKLKAK